MTPPSHSLFSLLDCLYKSVVHIILMILGMNFNFLGSLEENLKGDIDPIPVVSQIW